VPDPDLRPAAEGMSRLLSVLPADALAAPTPCPGMPVGALIDHVAGFARVFAATALDELVVHGWDIAVATRQAFTCDAATLDEVEWTVQRLRAGNPGELPGVFGPVIPLSADVSDFDRVVSLTGRDPGWSPT
jgi:hypothetical protein